LTGCLFGSGSPLPVVGRLGWLAVVPFLALGAQERAAGPAGSPPAVTVFLDCDQCDFDYLRTEITFVDYVRDRRLADVHVLVTSTSTGGGGGAYTIAFLGQGRLAGLGDTLVFSSRVTETDDEVRAGLTSAIRIGLVRYAVRAQGVRSVAVTVTGAGASLARDSGAADPWNAWVFSAGADGYTSGQQSTQSRSFDANLTGDRVTAAWKAHVGLSDSYSESRFETDSVNFTGIQRQWNASGLLVKSLSSHWSIGATGQLSSSEFLNERRAGALSPAIEYDLFPYAESTRRQLVLQYAMGISAFAYYDTTVYLKTREAMASARATVAFAERQPWGSVNVSAAWSTYLSDPRKNHAQISGGLNFRVLEGLTINLGGSYSSIHDQLYLPNEGATAAEILTQQHQLLTNYNYSMSFGFSYTFGSIFNNVVNPRMAGSS